jgi:hypothetical protein
MKKLLYTRRGILALLALLVLVVGALGGAIPYFYGLPDPAKANRHELLRWLVTRDIALESLEIQSALADRLESEFGKDVDWSSFRGKLSEAQINRLIHNIPAVLRPWMLKKSDTYAQLSADCRTAFVDRMIDTLEVWQGIEKVIPEPSGVGLSESQTPKLATLLTQEMEKLQKESTAAEQKKLGDLWLALQTRWFLRSFAPKM